MKLLISLYSLLFALAAIYHVLLRNHTSHLVFFLTRIRFQPTKANVVTCLKQLTESLIKELTHTLIRTRGISRSTTPQILQNIINSEACRGTKLYISFLRLS